MPKTQWNEKNLEMDLPLALKMLVISLQIFFVSRLLGETGVQLLQILSPSVDGSFALQLGLFQSGYFLQQSLLLFFPNADLCDRVISSQLVLLLKECRRIGS